MLQSTRVPRSFLTHERRENEVFDFVEDRAPIFLVKNIVVHTVEDAHALHVRAKSVKESPFSREIDDPVSGSGKYERWCLDRGSVGHEPRGGLMQSEQNVYRNRARYERVGIVVARLLG